MKNAMNNDSQVIVSKKERLHWLDYSKTIGMYLVVLGHVKDNTLLLKGIIYSFHMPFFFFLSGFLHKLRIGGGGGEVLCFTCKTISDSILHLQWVDFADEN